MADILKKTQPQVRRNRAEKPEMADILKKNPPSGPPKPSGEAGKWRTFLRKNRLQVRQNHAEKPEMADTLKKIHPQVRRKHGKREE